MMNNSYWNPDNEDFKISCNGKIYVDKSMLIDYTNSILHTPERFICVSRPRRFGKSTDANMLVAYYSKGCDSKALFDHLKIAHRDSYKKHLNKHHVIYLNMQSFVSNQENIQEMIKFLTSQVILELKTEISDVQFQDETKLRLCLEDIYRYKGEKFVFIIDEWDCIFREFPNDLNSQKVYLDFLRDLLKDKKYVSLAYMTGILPIKKYGTHSALNMFKEISMINPTPMEKFMGFTKEEVKKLCEEYQIDFDEMKAWYDGYHFGNMEVYCPWDVMNYVRDLQNDPKAAPAGYWKNTSDNAIIRSFIDYAGNSITKKLETLLSGQAIVQKVEENLTYDYLHASEENLWSVLYLIAYLTKAVSDSAAESSDEGKSALVIPNAESREIFETTIKTWFDDNVRLWNWKALFHAVWTGDCDTAAAEMNRLLRKTISYHDYKEDFYHAFFAGIFAGAGYVVESNKEHGEGRNDVIVYAPSEGQAAVFEIKYSKDVESLSKDCNAALRQMDTRMYAKELEDDYDQVLCYGISFFKKWCVIRKKS